MEPASQAEPAQLPTPCTSCCTAPSLAPRSTHTSGDLADPPIALRPGGSYISGSRVDINCSRTHCCRTSCHPSGPKHHSKIGSVSGWGTSVATKQRQLTSLRTSKVATLINALHEQVQQHLLLSIRPSHTWQQVQDIFEN